MTPTPDPDPTVTATLTPKRPIPQDWPVNAGVWDVLNLLAPVRDQYENLSWADLIVLAGGVALEDGAPGLKVPFCPGRTDASDGNGSTNLQVSQGFGLGFVWCGPLSVSAWGVFGAEDRCAISDEVQTMEY